MQRGIYADGTPGGFWREEGTDPQGRAAKVSIKDAPTDVQLVGGKNVSPLHLTESPPGAGVLCLCSYKKLICAEGEDEVAGVVGGEKADEVVDSEF